MRREFIHTKYGDISFLRRQGSNTVLMIHGLGGTGSSFLKLLPYMEENLDLIMIDLLGHGNSDKPVIDYTIETQVMMILEFLEKMKIEDFSLMGNSYGGWISMRLSLIKKPIFLILEDSAGINPTFGELDEKLREKFIENLLKSNSLNQRHVLESIIKNNADPKWKMKDNELAELNSKTLIIWGSDDNVIPIKYGELLNRKIMGSKMYIVEGGGHVPHAKKPDRVSKIINENLVFQ